jgi:hypothetical protein
MTFGKQRHCQENGSCGGGKTNPDFGISVDAKTPLQSRANIREIGKAGWFGLSLILNSFKKPAVIFSMPPGDSPQFAAFGQFLKGVGPCRFEQPKTRRCPGGIRVDQRLRDQVRDIFRDVRRGSFVAARDSVRGLQRKGGREYGETLEELPLGARQKLIAPIQGCS